MEAGHGSTKPEQFNLVLSPDRMAGWRARQAVRERFARSIPARTLIDVVSVVTELVNNAVTHGPGRPITVTLVVGEESIHGEVADQGNPATAIPEIKKSRGQGLELVDKLTSQWAVYEGSTHVWFEMPLES